MPQSQDELMALTTQIVSAHVAHNEVSPEQLPALIHSVFTALGNANSPPPAATEPAVAVRSSVRPDAVTCLDCGKQFSMLKRHLNTDHSLTPQQYRAKWNLPHDYPMVAPNYAKVRSNLAKKIGLGRVGISSPRNPRAKRKIGRQKRA